MLNGLSDLPGASAATSGTVRSRAAVLGSPIEHSLSPVLHRAAYDSLGLRDWSYDRFAVGGPGEPDLGSFLAGLGPEWVGLSVTMPLKEEALALAVAASGHARELAAANTLVRGEHGWIAESTDAYGLLETLLGCGLHPGALRRAAVLGAGATARSGLDALARLGAERVDLLVRAQPRPETVAFARSRGLAVTARGLAETAEAVAAADVTISTLPTGTDLRLAPLPPGALDGRLLVDVVYGGWPTPLAAWAAGAGARVVSGLEMLVHQAVEQVRLMTGRQPSADGMRAAALAHLRSTD